MNIILELLRKAWWTLVGTADNREEIWSKDLLNTMLEWNPFYSKFHPLLLYLCNYCNLDLTSSDELSEVYGKSYIFPLIFLYFKASVLYFQEKQFFCRMDMV
jgi:hypothetical protein